MRSMDRQTAGTALADYESSSSIMMGGVSTARFAGVDADGRFQVELGEARSVVRAVSTIALTSDDAGTMVVIALENGNPGRPVILGRVRERAESAVASVRVDGDRLTITAERQIELRCGDASIVLTRAGKVLIRGRYVLSRSRGANKIKGAHVDIN